MSIATLIPNPGNRFFIAELSAAESPVLPRSAPLGNSWDKGLDQKRQL
jgi:hypothetical protein